VSVFESLIGHDAVVHALAAYAATPSHAYLFTGPAGTGKLDAALAFAAALQCANGGCGECDRCRQTLSGADADVATVRRVGLSWSVAEINDVERLARRKPLLGRYQIVILPSVEQSALSAPALLKVLEEPPATTVFLLLADELPPWLTTIESRCVKLEFGPLRPDDVVARLVREGAEELPARLAAEAAGGNLDRARLLLDDEGVARRMALWRAVPDTLSTRSPASLAHEIVAEIEDAVKPLQDAQARELDELRDEAEMLGRRGIVNRKDVEDRHKREIRRYRTDDLVFGLAVLTRAYRERLVGALEGLSEGDRRSRLEAKGAARAVDEAAKAAAALRGNANPEFLLTTFFTTLAGL